MPVFHKFIVHALSGKYSQQEEDRTTAARNKGIHTCSNGGEKTKF